MYVSNFICTQIAQVAAGPECSIHAYNRAERLQVFPLPPPSPLKSSIYTSLCFPAQAESSGRSLSWTRGMNLLYIREQGEIFERTGDLFCFCSFSRPQFFLISGKKCSYISESNRMVRTIPGIFSYTSHVSIHLVKPFKLLGEIVI